jgi:hypothetical protein
MAGSKGWQALIKRPAPEDMLTHCFKHGESLITKEFCPHLMDVCPRTLLTSSYIESVASFAILQMRNLQSGRRCTAAY